MIREATSLSEALKLSRALLANKQKASDPSITIDGDETTLFSGNEKKIYIPTGTGKIAHDDNSFIRLIMGPYGSGKSTWAVNEIVRKVCAMPKWYHGRRRAKWAIVRNTSGELQSTTLQTWLAWFGDLGEIKKRQKPLMTYEHVFNDGNGVVELELIFIALDREQDLRKIKSLEVTGCYINELSEVPQGALSHFKGRVNYRYPSRSFCPEPYWSGIICDTNPPDVDHWIYKDFEQKSLDSYRIFHQPKGLLKDDKGKWYQNINCDNHNNIAKDYYTKMAEGQNEDFIKVYCLGEYGSVSNGKVVYPEYNDDLHGVDHIDALQGEPIHLGWDFGLTPACLVMQFTARGQLRVLKEYNSEDMGIKTFAESIVIPNLERDFPYCKVGISKADPSGLKSDEIMEELSCIGILNNLGIPTEGARTNNLDPRIGSVRYFLNRMIDGKPGFLIDKTNAPNLRKGFIKNYGYKRIGIANEDRYRDIPDKTHPYSDIHDCLQYVAMEFAADNIVKNKHVVETVDMFNPVMRMM